MGHHLKSGVSDFNGLRGMSLRRMPAAAISGGLPKRGDHETSAVWPLLSGDVDAPGGRVGMTMAWLCATTILPPSVRRPAYDRGALSAGILHLGPGAFHRAHQAVYTDAALARRPGDWGIVGVSLRSSGIARDLEAQDGLFTVVTREPGGDSAQIVGALVGGLAARRDGARLLSLLADPSIRIVSMTATEKAYGIDPETGGLDTRHPAVSADLASPEAPGGVVGLLVEGLARRRRLGITPFTALCCDNLPDNGAIVRRLVLEMAARRAVGLADWIDRNAGFPSCMVDRIVPAPTDETRARAARLTGADDALAVESEAFSQWVVEDRFVSGRPEWEAGGALFVDSVRPYETMKLRLLNGAHSLIAYLGRLHGLEHVRDVMRDPAHVGTVRRHIAAAARTLGPVPGIDLAAYAQTLIERFANPQVAHRTAQIAMDGSQKLPQRIFAPAVETLAAGGDADAFALVTGLWLAFLRRTPVLDDPRAAALAAAAATSAPAGDATVAFFGVPGLFPPPLVANRAWRDRVNVHFDAGLRIAA